MWICMVCRWLPWICITMGVGVVSMDMYYRGMVGISVVAMGTYVLWSGWGRHVMWYPPKNNHLQQHLTPVYISFIIIIHNNIRSWIIPSYTWTSCDGAGNRISVTVPLLISWRRYSPTLPFPIWWMLSASTTPTSSPAPVSVFGPSKYPLLTSWTPMKDLLSSPPWLPLTVTWHRETCRKSCGLLRTTKNHLRLWSLTSKRRLHRYKWYLRMLLWY